MERKKLSSGESVKKGLYTDLPPVLVRIIDILIVMDSSDHEYLKQHYLPMDTDLALNFFNLYISEPWHNDLFSKVKMKVDGKKKNGLQFYHPIEDIEFNIMLSRMQKDGIFNGLEDCHRDLINFYNTDIFKNYRAGQLYKKVVVTKLFIDEPFHTVFTQLLQIYAHTHSWIKSSKTKEIRLKVRTKDAKFEEGISFKVYSISEIVFDLLENILEHFDKKKNKKKRYTKEDQKNIILSVLIWKLDCVKEFKYLCDKNLNDIKFRECLAKKILREYDENHNIFQILQMLEEGHKKVQFIFRLHDRAMKWQQEYPYVSKGEEEYIKINIDKLANQHMKNLMRVDSFSVY
jgi:hypothetical protein